MDFDQIWSGFFSFLGRFQSDFFLKFNSKKKKKPDQTWSNLIKTDQIWSNVIKNHVLIRFDQFWSDLIRFFLFFPQDFSLGLYCENMLCSRIPAQILSNSFQNQKGNLWKRDIFFRKKSAHQQALKKKSLEKSGKIWEISFDGKNWQQSNESQTKSLEKNGQKNENCSKLTQLRKFQREDIWVKKYLTKIWGRKKFSKLTHLNKIQRENIWVNKLPHQNLREKNFSKLTHLRKVQRENIWVKKKIPHQNLREQDFSKLTHLKKLQRENIWVKKIPHQNLREKKFSKLTHLRKVQRENIWFKQKKYLAKI